MARPLGHPPSGPFRVRGVLHGRFSDDAAVRRAGALSRLIAGARCLRVPRAVSAGAKGRALRDGTPSPLQVD